MVADGILIDMVSLLKIKDQLVRVLGYEDVFMVPSASGHTFFIQFGRVQTIPSSSFSCFSDLVLLLDSPQPFELSCAAIGGPDVDDETSSSLLVGSAFVDVLLNLFEDSQLLLSLPPLILKSLLRALIIVMQKHDFDSRPLRHLQGVLRKALRTCLSLLFDEEYLSLELRQLALSTCQVFVSRWPGVNVMGLFI
jgi:hypothetical protein